MKNTIKKIIIVTVLNFLLSEVYSQSTLVFAPDSSKWEQQAVVQYAGIGAPHIYEYANYFIHGDTVANNKTYQKLYTAGTNTVGIDTVCYSFSRYILNDSGVIYIGVNIDSLKPIYNFNLVKGDSFPVIGFNDTLNQSYVFYPQVDSTDIIFYAGKNRRRIIFDSSLYHIDGPVWIEGVGDRNYGLLFDYYEIMRLAYCPIYGGPCSSWSIFDCFYDGGNKNMVGTCEYTNCSLNSIQTFEGNNKLYIYPNPANMVLQVTVGSNWLSEVKLFDILGNEMLKTQQKEIDVSALPIGVYFMQVKTNEDIIIKKIIIQH